MYYITAGDYRIPILAPVENGVAAHFARNTLFACKNYNTEVDPFSKLYPVFPKDSERYSGMGAPRQFLSGDKQTIVCVHPTKPTPLTETKVTKSISIIHQN